MKYKNLYITSRVSSPANENPFTSYVSNDINENKRKASKLGEGYIVNFGGGFTEVTTKFRSHKSSLAKKHIASSSSKYRVQRGPPKMLKRILKHLGKRKQVLTSFWMEHTVEKWKQTLLYLVFKAWVYVVQVGSKKEGRFIEMIKNMRGHTTKQWFERWVTFYQERQKVKIKKDKIQTAIDLKLNFKMLELKSAEATSINNTLGQDIKYLKMDVEHLKHDLEQAKTESMRLRRSNAEISKKLEVLNIMVSSEESSTPIFLQGCKSSVISFATNIGPQICCKLRSVTKILSYLLKRWKSSDSWKNPLLLAPYLLKNDELNDNSKNQFEISHSLRHIEEIEDKINNTNCRMLSMAWMEFHYHQQEKKYIIKKKKRPIVMPEDLVDGYIWSVILDSIVEDGIAEKRGIRRQLWKIKRQRERTNELLSTFKKLGIYAATTLNSYVKFRDGTPSEHYAVLTEVMRKYPALKPTKLNATLLIEDCIVARKSLKQIDMLKDELKKTIAGANNVDFANITSKAEADAIYESLHCRIVPFEKLIKTQLKKIEEIEQNSLNLLISWPRWTNMWKSIVLDCSIYSKRALKYAEDAATAGSKVMNKRDQDENNNDIRDLSHQKDNNTILAAYSNVSLPSLQVIYNALAFTSDNFVEIKSIIRLQSSKIHKVFQFYTTASCSNANPKIQSTSQHIDDSKSKNMTYLQWWWMAVDFGFIKCLQGQTLEEIYSKSITNDNGKQKKSIEDEAISIFSTCSKAQFSLALIRLCSIMYTDQHPCDSFPSFMEAYINEDVLETSSDNLNYSDIRSFISTNSVLKVIEEFESEIIANFQKYATIDVNNVYKMDIEELLLFLNMFDFLNYRVHEKKIRRIFREITGSISKCTQPINEGITYIQFLLLLIIMFLVDEPNPFKSRHASLKAWVIQKFKVKTI
jgi:hypothetical protein